MAGELNFNLLNTNAPAQIANSVMAGQQMARQERMQVQQMASQERMQNQQEKLGGMQLRTAERDMASADRRQAGLDNFLRLSAENGKTGSPEELADSFFDFAVSSGNPQLIMSAQTTRQAARERNAYMASKQPTSPDMPAPANNMLGQPPVAQTSANQLPGANEAASIESQINRLQREFPNVPAAQEEVKRLAKRLDDMTKSTTVAPGSSVFQGGRAVFTAPERTDTDLIRNFNAAVAGGFRGNLFQYQAEIARAGRAPSAPRAEPAPRTQQVPLADGTIGLVNMDTGAVTPLTMGGSPVIGRGQGVTIAPKEIQKREAAFPQATASVKGFDTKADAFIKDLQALRDDPGLVQITGAIFGRTPSASRSGSRAQALYDKVTAKGGFQALQDMRDASKTGGALGNVSNQEGKQLTASFAAIDRRQSAEDVRAALDQSIATIEGSKTRMREAYDSTYEYRTARPQAPSGAPGVDAKNPLLN